MKVLVVAPHPDDEVLGVGGTLHRLAAAGHAVTVAIATKGWAPLFPDSQVAQVRAEAQAAADILGVRRLRFMDLPVTRLNELPRSEVNAAFDRLFAEEQPDWALLPHPGDRHEDHRQCFAAAMVATRPVAGRPTPRRILCYETVSETHWAAAGLEPAFAPHVWLDVSDHLEAKLAAMRAYASQVRPAPDARSLEAVRALAVWRGTVVGMKAAETFMVVREFE
jgi:LmbE family N-acetylglucosaminyl deacetylase